MRLYPSPGNETLGDLLAAASGLEQGRQSWHRFPDGETVVRIETPPGDEACLICTLADPDKIALPLLFASRTLREQGAKRVGLIAPYLGYMRQDAVFLQGQGISARYFCGLLAQHFDWLLTVDPHLHRIHDLADVFDRPHRVLHAAPLLGDWIRVNVERPLLIGPDGESEQWVAAVAERIGAPWISLTKQRLGDQQVKVSLPPLGAWQGRTPVFVDDIVSTGHTLVEAARALDGRGLGAPLCVAVHGLFAGAARALLQDAGFSRYVVSNSVPQPESLIDLTALLTAGLQTLAGGGDGS